MYDIIKKIQKDNSVIVSIVINDVSTTCFINDRRVWSPTRHLSHNEQIMPQDKCIDSQRNRDTAGKLGNSMSAKYSHSVTHNHEGFVLTEP